MLIDKELFDKFFKVDNKNNFINIDIDTFELFNELLATGEIKNNRHKTFAFGYYCLVSYLWKYSKYGEQEINTQDLKRLMLIIPTEKRFDYLIKKGGVLDSMGLTETTKDFPISTSFNELNQIEVTTLSMVDKDMAKDWLQQYGKRYTCKKPLPQYDRGDKVGLMFSKDDVLSLSVFEITRILLCNELGFDGLFVYAYLKYRNKMLGGNGVTMYYSELEKQIGYKQRRIRELISNLVSVDLLQIEAEFSHENNKVSRTNTYKIISPLNQGIPNP